MTGPVLLDASHDVSAFDCGVEALNLFLRKHALANSRSDAARTFVVHRESRVVGYYSLCAASVGPEEVPDRVRKGLPRHPVPLVLLARLAVDESEQGRGLGAALLKDAMKRFLAAQETIAARALLVHAKDDGAVAFYERYGFVSAPGFPYHLYLLTKDIRAMANVD